MNTTGRTAYLKLLEAAGSGHEFRVSEVLSKFEGDPERIVGRGRDLDETVPIIGQTADTVVDGQAAVRVMQMPAAQPAELLVRVRVNWQSDFGAHSSYMSCLLTPPAIERLDEVGERDATTADKLLQLLHLPRVKKDLAQAWLMTIFELAKPYRVKWVQEFPRMMNDAMHDMVSEYHRRAVERVRATEPGMLGLLSPTYLDAGRLSPADLAGLCRWLHEARSEESAA